MNVRKIILFILMLVVVAGAAAHFGCGFLKSTKQPLVLVSEHPAATPQAGATAKLLPSYRGLPVRLKIPALSVDSSIEFMGNTKEGSMAAPASAVVTGWYKYGAIPGESGTSVIDGHVVGPKGEPGVFKNLAKLLPGDVIQVVDAKNKTASFIVTLTENFDETQQHAEVFFSVSGTHLNLITCSGDWNASRHEYEKRLVVFADGAP